MKKKYLLIISLFFFCSKKSFASAEEIPNCEKKLTTIEINRCLSLKLEAFEAEMATYLAKSRARFTGDSITLESIDQAQETWLTYRQAHCDSVLNIWRDGTVRTSKFIECSTELTKQRTFAIWKSFLTYADSTPPLLRQPSRSR